MLRCPPTEELRQLRPRKHPADVDKDEEGLSQRGGISSLIALEQRRALLGKVRDDAFADMLGLFEDGAARVRADAALSGDASGGVDDAATSLR